MPPELSAVSAPESPLTLVRRNQAVLAVLVVGILASVSLRFIPSDSLGYIAVGLSLSIAVFGVVTFRTIRSRGQNRIIWACLAGYTFLVLVGDAIYDYQVYHLQLAPVVGAADAAYAGAYFFAFAALGTLLIYVHPGNALDAWADTLILSLTSVAIVLVFLLPALPDIFVEPSVDSLIVVAYPVLDMLVAAQALVLLIFSGRQRSLTLTLIATAFTALAVGDLIYSLTIAQGIESSLSLWMEPMLAVGSVILGSSALASDSRHIAERQPEDSPTTLTRRGRLLSVTGLLAPLIILHAVWTDAQKQTVLILAIIAFLVAALVLARILGLFRTVQRQSALLEAQAQTDALTGLPNRRMWDDHLAVLEREKNITLAMMDLDHFKEYNDTNGHQSGDVFLARVGKVWAALLPDTMFLARYGGEEFAVVMPGVSVKEAGTLLEQLRTAVPFGRSVSIGYASRRPNETLNDVLRRADRALYSAKRRGRNTVIYLDGDDSN